MQLPISAKVAVEHVNTRLSEQVRQIRELEGLRLELGRIVERLQRALERSGARTDEELVFVPGGLSVPSSAGGPVGRASLERQRRLERTWQRVREMAREMAPEARSLVASRIRAQGLFRRAEVEAEVQRIGERQVALASAAGRLLTDLRRIMQADLPTPALAAVRAGAGA